MFSSRLKSRADYLWACHLVDTLIALQHLGHGVSDEHVNKFSTESDKHNKLHKLKYIACLLLVLAQGVFLLVAFALLAYPIYRMLAVRPP